jgi:hypothetical protein
MRFCQLSLITTVFKAPMRFSIRTRVRQSDRQYSKFHRK